MVDRTDAEPVASAARALGADDCARRVATVGLPVLLCDADLLVVHKPSGLCVHRGLSRDTDTVMARLRTAQVAAGPVHRLDRGTSGVLVLARSRRAAQVLGSALSAGSWHKQYVALVRGSAPERVTVVHPVPCDEGGARVPARTVVARVAEVRIDSALREPRYSLVSAWPETGRFHQVRRHLSHLHHPVIGDANYGRGEHNRFLRERIGLERLALHALELRFDHPATGEALTIAAGLPNDLLEPLTRLGFAAALLAGLGVASVR